MDRLCERVKNLGQSAVAITDHGNIFGLPDFAAITKKNGLKGILGCEAYTLWELNMEDRPSREENHMFHMCLLAKNLEGYRNLGHLISRAHTRGFYYKPRIDLKTLAEFSKGVIATSGCLQGKIPNALTRGDYGSAETALNRYIEIFGRENFFIEVQNHGIPEQIKILPDLFKLADENGVKVIATNDAHYVNPEDWEAHDALLCIQTASKLSDANRMRMPWHQFYVKSREEMALLFGERPDSLDNTLLVSEMCDVDLPYGENHYPVYNLAEDLTARHGNKAHYLKSLCIAGLQKRYGVNYDSPESNSIALPYEISPQVLVDRMNHELEVIYGAGFTDYFLVVWDFIDWANKHHISVGPGRGSGAGSIVAYCLQITDIDPMRFGLIFERFLNPERISPPDFDIDFCMRRRDEVIDYVREKYGRDGVANIITFGTFGAKMTLRDLARVNDIPYSEANRLTKMIPDELGIDLKTAVTKSKELQQEIKNSPLIRKIIDQGQIIEGTVRNTGTHACGMVITDEPMENLIPVTLQEGNLTTQFSKDYVEQLGLLKMDFLGLKTLTVIADAEQFIRQKDPDFSIKMIPLDDQSTFDLINSGENAGIFQLESPGMRALCRQFGVMTIEEISDLSALYRPGPMEWIPDYIQGKRDPDRVHYAHPLLESICRETYGVMIYQEQVMKAAQVVAGYSLGGADILRRAMGKKKVEVMAEQRAVFVKGAAKNGLTEKKANEIFDILAKFAGYGFNKSHSIAYALIAYQTAYLKAHQPLEFMAALLSSELGNPEKMSYLIGEWAGMGIPVLGPHVNYSTESFTPISPADEEKDCIRFGLAAVKGVGSASTESILRERNLQGPFKNFADFAWRVDSKAANKRVFENLISSGAFDDFGIDRQHLLNSLERILKQKSKATKAHVDSLQCDLFADSHETPLNPFESLIETTGPIMSHGEKLRHEKELLGFYISGHPLDSYFGLEKSIDALPSEEQMSAGDNLPFFLIGSVGEITKKIAKKSNRLWGHVQIGGRQGDYVVNFFPEAYEKYLHLLIMGNIIVVNGVVRTQDERRSMNVTEAYGIDEFIRKFGKRLQIRIDASNEKALDDFLDAFSEYLEKHPGNLPLDLDIQQEEKRQKIRIPTVLRAEMDTESFHPLTQLKAFNGISLQTASYH